MKKKHILAIFILLMLVAAFSVMLFPDSSKIPVLDPKGMIAMKERDLFITVTLLMLIVVIPVFVLMLLISWKYRASNTKAKYMPDWDYNFLVESIWWGVPCVIIIVLSVLTWESCHELDPFKPLKIEGKPLTIQVVALRWKWLFIYPEHSIASMSFVQFPEKTPINFQITSDAPMNSFWIPQLAGQIYAMPGMRTKLHLIADEVGSFRGASANLSGTGFAKMTFTANSLSQADFSQWVQSVQQSPNHLGIEEYTKLVEPTEGYPMAVYQLKESGLYDRIIMKYMMPPP